MSTTGSRKRHCFHLPSRITGYSKTTRCIQCFFFPLLRLSVEIGTFELSTFPHSPSTEILNDGFGILNKKCV